MYMRYAGGGVGHYRVTLLDTPANANEIQEDFAVEDNVMADPQKLTNLELEERGTVPEAAGLEEVEECIQDDNIEDHCSDSEGEEDDENILTRMRMTLGQRMVKEGFLMLKMMKGMQHSNCRVLQTQRQQLELESNYILLVLP